jgi:dTDP-glucose 4,6-dehydratase
MSWVLVTGGAGFIGANFLAWLRGQRPEAQIINLDLLTYAGNPENLIGFQDDSRYTLVKGDVADRELVEDLFRRYPISQVVHFAAESHVDRSILDPGVFVRTNVVGTFTLLEAARLAWTKEGGPEAPRFLHVSTDEVYGSLTPEAAPVTEAAPYAPRSPYAASKASADFLVRAYWHTYELPVLITNCSNNYGPYQFPEKLIPLIISNAVASRELPVYGAGANVRDWLHVEDHCRALDLVVRNGAPGRTYNIGGSNERTNLEVVHAICDLVDELRPLSTGGSRRDLIRFVADRPGHDLRYAIDASRIRSELGWVPSYDFTTGLRATVRWYLDNAAWCETVMADTYDGSRLGLNT